MVCGCLKECYPTLLTIEVVGNTGSVVSSAIRNIFKVYSVGELVQLISFLQNEKKKHLENRNVRCSRTQYSVLVMDGRMGFNSRQGQRFVSSPQLPNRL